MQNHRTKEHPRLTNAPLPPRARTLSQDPTRLDFKQLILSGTTAGAFQMSATYPLEVVRSRLSVGPALGIEYKGIVDCARKTIAAEGIGGLYRGYMVGLTTGAPYVGLQMTIYDILKRYAPKREDGGTDVVYKLITGATAGVAAQTAVYPGDLVRRRLHLNGQVRRGALPLPPSSHHPFLVHLFAYITHPLTHPSSHVSNSCREARRWRTKARWTACERSIQQKDRRRSSKAAERIAFARYLVLRFSSRPTIY